MNNAESLGRACFLFSPHGTGVVVHLHWRSSSESPWAMGGACAVQRDGVSASVGLSLCHSTQQLPLQGSEGKQRGEHRVL